MMPHSDTFYPKHTHLIDHLNLSEGQAIQPVYFNHVTLTMSFSQLGETERERKRKREVNLKKKIHVLKTSNTKTLCAQSFSQSYDCSESASKSLTHKNAHQKRKLSASTKQQHTKMTQPFLNKQLVIVSTITHFI